MGGEQPKEKGVRESERARERPQSTADLRLGIQKAKGKNLKNEL